MKQANIVEIVIWQPKVGITANDMTTEILKLNDFVKTQPGFISRKTAIAKDGNFLDVVLWTDLASAEAASQQLMQQKELQHVFASIDEKTMLFKHFEIFNHLD